MTRVLVKPAPPVQPAVPDAITDSGENPKYRTGCNERKAAQAEHEADKVIIEYHEETIKRLEAAILAEREACAKECKFDRTSADIEIAIRARGNK
jgi:hypothetical protein